jgi:DNA-directed RNA polymerase
MMPGLLQGTDFDRQVLIERKGKQRGRDAYWRDRDKAHEKGRIASTPPGRRWLAHWAVALNIAIRQKRRQLMQEGKWTRTEAVAPYLLVTPKKAAAITLTVMLNALFTGNRVNQARMFGLVGRAILAQAQLDRWQKEKKYDLIRAMFKKRRRNAIKPSDVNKYAAVLDQDAIYDPLMCVRVGQHFVWDAVGACSAADEGQPFALAFHRDTVRKGVKTSKQFRLDDAVRRTIAYDEAALADLRVIYPPMVVPPYKHEDSTRGGYITLPMRIITQSTPAQRSVLRDNLPQMAEYLDGLTALGNTAARVNKWQLGVVDALMEEGGGIAGLPRATSLDLPPKPGTDDEAVQREWRNERVRVRRENLKNESEFITAYNARQVAREFMDEPRLYMPHQADFRSRAYAKPQYLNHYGNDLQRSLIEFADPVDGPDVTRQVAIQAATMFGHDKISFEDRIEWVKENIREIGRSASDPRNTGFWREAENPLQFLVACRALMKKDAAVHLPVQRDATASGFQHFAAMMRDEVAAEHVNLYPTDKPSALYATLAGIVRRALEKEEQTPAHTLAIEILTKHGKAVCKQTVMTTPYGVTAYGAGEQVRARLVELGFTGDLARDAKRLIVKRLMEGVRTMFPRVCEAMDWIRGAAEQIAKANRPVIWRTPVGWVTVQPYSADPTVCVNTEFGRVLVAANTLNKVHVKQQVNGAAPNFVHGIDTAVLMRTAVECRNRGVAFLGVHDSFWSHAATAEQVGDTAMRKFAETHANPLLTDLWLQWREQHTDIEFSPPPACGEFDVNTVIAANYAMC